MMINIIIPCPFPSYPIVTLYGLEPEDPPTIDHLGCLEPEDPCHPVEKERFTLILL